MWRFVVFLNQVITWLSVALLNVSQKSIWQWEDLSVGCADLGITLMYKMLIIGS